MLLPIGDLPNSRDRAWVNLILISINVGVFLLIAAPLMLQPADLTDPRVRELVAELVRVQPHADPQAVVRTVLSQLSAYDVFVMGWGYRAEAPSLATLFSSMFLHAGWMHLVGNMLFLWIFGDNVEHRLGRVPYLVTYLVCGGVATLAYAALLPESSGNIPLVGASGAISGVLGLYFVWFPRNDVRLLIFFFPFFVDVWNVGARWILGVYLLIDNLLPLLLDDGHSGGVAHGAHIGGFLAGAAIAVTFEKLGHRNSLRTTSQTYPLAMRPAGEDLSHDLATLAPHDAVGTYLRLPPHGRRAVPLQVVLDLADWLVGQSAYDAALNLYQQAAADHSTDPERARAWLGIGLTLWEGHGDLAAAYRYLDWAARFATDPQTSSRARRAIDSIQRSYSSPVRRRRWGAD